MRGMGRVYRRRWRDKSTGLWREGKIWWLDYSHRGRRQQESSHTTSHADAVRLLRKRIKAVESGERTGRSIDRVTLGELLDMVKARHVNDECRSLNRDKSLSENLLAHFGKDTLAIDVTETKIEDYIAKRKTAGRSNGTIRRELAFLRRAFRLGRKLVSTIPEIRMPKEPPPREGFTTYDELQRILRELPDALRDPVEFLFHSCWRVGEALSLQWRDVNFDTGEITLRAENVKIEESRSLPLHAEIAEIIARAHKRRQLDCPYVFHRNGRQIKRIYTNVGAWPTACRKAGLGHVLIHDQRRSGMKHFVETGTSDMKTIMAFSGHKDASTFLRYRIVDQGDMKRALDRAKEHRANTPATPSNVVPITRHSTGQS